MLIKKITMYLYYVLVIATFIYVVSSSSFDVGAAELFFGILFPCSFYWLMHNWLSKSDIELEGSWIIWLNHLFYFFCFLAGIVVLYNIYLDPSNAAMLFVLLPFIQGLVYLVGVAVIASAFIFSKDKRQVH